MVPGSQWKKLVGKKEETKCGSNGHMWFSVTRRVRDTESSLNCGLSLVPFHQEGENYYTNK